jgi:hypothetical protein
LELRLLSLSVCLGRFIAPLVVLGFLGACSFRAPLGDPVGDGDLPHLPTQTQSQTPAAADVRPDSLPRSSPQPSGNALPPGLAQRPNYASPIGANLFKITTPEMLWFTDQMKRADGWLTQCDESCGYIWDTGEQDQLLLDAQGWVIGFGDDPNRRFTHVAAVLYAGAPHLAPAGIWTVLYEGEGVIDYDYSPFVQVVDRMPGQDLLRISPQSEGVLRIRLSEIHPENHLRNIRVFPPGGLCGEDPFAYAAHAGECAPGVFRPFAVVAETHRFHPLFLQELGIYRVLRFMQVQGIVEVLTPEPWDARSRLDAAIYPGGWGGIPPLELIFELSNLLDADPWVAMPHWADDTYVAEFARLAHARLAPHLSVYVEYANEVWNTAYPFNVYGNEIEGWAHDRWPNVTDAEGGPVSGFDKRMNYFGMRSAQICALWKEVWREEARRVRCVMGGAPWDIPTETALSCPIYVAERQGDIPHCATQMDALAVAPYFGGYISDSPNAEGGHFEQLLEWTQADDGGLDLLFYELRTGALLQAAFHQFGAIEAAAQIARNNKPLADRYRLTLIAYEGGQHLAPVSHLGTTCVPWQQLPECAPARAIQELYIAANRDARMGELYAAYLEAWRAAGGTLLVHYHALGQPAYRFGAWGAKEYAGQPDQDAPKYRALRAFAQTTTCWWPACRAGELRPQLGYTFIPDSRR